MVVEIEPLDAILPALVQVHRAGMRDLKHPGAVDRAHEPALVVDEVVLDR